MAKVNKNYMAKKEECLKAVQEISEAGETVEKLPEPTKGKYSSELVLRKLYEMAQEGNTSAAKIYLDFMNKLGRGITDIMTLEDALRCIEAYEKSQQIKNGGLSEEEQYEKELIALEHEAQEEKKRRYEMELQMQRQLRQQSGTA